MSLMRSRKFLPSPSTSWHNLMMLSSVILNKSYYCFRRIGDLRNGLHWIFNFIQIRKPFNNLKVLSKSHKTTIAKFSNWNNSSC
ncbi:CNT_HP2_G0035060.mRNA.1.CDS.1 [Saccharomyces cerevisiae]|nr:CNT_HP2_G0035060.mRNA.1.CDS.1 [Saccharomyces cerevisiae]CAI6654738.1 CNT_HP2_G0035060.mRNA.1.CDS.1 [Saccharomyces cerevisiae]